jgi:hypothetical protein
MNRHKDRQLANQLMREARQLAKGFHEDSYNLAPQLSPDLPVDDRQLAEDLTLRGIAVEGIHDLGFWQWFALRDGHYHQPRGCDESLWRGARGGGYLRT